MKKYLIEAVYNDKETAIAEHNNYRETIIVSQESFDTFKLLVETRFYNVDKDGNETERINEPYVENLLVSGPVWELMFEDIERCYPAFHAYAVGYDGGHLNYMEINFKGEIE